MRYFIVTVRTALRALWRNPMRSGLTTLGIVIGVAAVIAMTEIGQGTNRAVERTIKSMGANNLLIQPGTATSSGVSFGSGSVVTLTPQDAEAIARECYPVVAAVAPIVRARTQVVFGNKNWVPLYIYGTTPTYLEVRDWEDLAEGDPFTVRDVDSASSVCMVGQTVARELFGEESPLGQEVRINNVPFKIIGVLSRKGASMMGLDQDDILLAPWTTIKFRVSGQSLASVNQSATAAIDPVLAKSMVMASTPTPSTPFPRLTNDNFPVTTNAATVRFTNIDQILCKARTPEEVPNAIAQITDLLAERHRIKPGEPNDFSIRDMTEITRTLGSTSTMMMRTLLFVALVSLFVGGVGIMNIMMVSVTERTREIGLRMAVGAGPGDILRQFLVEAIVLCLAGGLLGIVLGRGVAIVVRATLGWPTELSIPAIAAAVGVSAFVGIVFGFYPAWKASRLDPIEALRYE